jgi:glycosyltransferase involved in cell wall biosynthesis
LTERVLFIGKIPHEKIQAFIKSSDVFSLPSLYEPSAVVLLDAIAAETPIVATNIGGTPEIVERYKVGLLVKAKNSKDLAKKITELLKNKRLREKIKKNQRKTLNKYLWKNLVKRYIRTYENLASL